MSAPRSIVTAETPLLGAGASIVPLSADVGVGSLGAGAAITHLSASTEVERLAAVARVVLAQPGADVALPLSQVLCGSATICQLAVEHALSGAVTGVAVVTGTFESVETLEGSVAGTSLVTGALVLFKGLAGSVSGTATVTGAVEKGEGLVLDPITGTATVVGAVDRVVGLAGSAAGSATVTGALVGGTVELVPQAVGGVITIIHGEVITDIEGNPLIAINQDISIATCTVEREVDKVLAGAVSATSSATAQIAVEVAIEAETYGVAVTACDILKTGGLEGSADGSATTAGTVARSRALDPVAITTDTTITANILVDVALVGSVTGTATVSQDLSVEHPLAGSSAGSATVSGTVAGDLEIAGSVSGVATVLSAAVSVEHPLAGSVTGDGTTTCYVGRTQVLTPSAGDIEDSNTSASTSGTYLAYTTGRYVAWSRFVASSSYDVDKLEAIIIEVAGDTDCDVKAVIFSDNSDIPGTQIGGESTTVSKDSFTTSETWFEFTFPSGDRPSLSNGTTYWWGLVPIGTPSEANSMRAQRNGAATKIGSSAWPYVGSLGDTSTNRQNIYRVYAAGGISGLATVSGAVAVEVNLIPVVTGAATVVGATSVAHPLAGSVAGGSSAAGTIQGDLDIIPTAVTGEATVVGATSVAHPLAGSVSASATVGELGVGRTVPLTGDAITGGATVSGGVAVGVVLGGTVNGTSSDSAAVDMARALTLDAVTGDAATVGAVDVDADMVPDAISGVATTAGAIDRGVGIATDAVDGAATAAGAIDISRALVTDSITGSATTSGAADLERGLEGDAITGDATVAAAIDMSRTLALDATTGDATSTGAVTVAVVLVPTAITGDATVAGTVQTDIELAGSVTGSATSAAAVSVGVDLVGSVAGDSTVVGAVSREVSLEPASGGSEDPFDISGAVYYAVAPATYSYSAEETTNYGARKYTTVESAVDGLPSGTYTAPQVINIIGPWPSNSSEGTSYYNNGTPTATNYVLTRALGDAKHNGIPSGETGANSDAYRNIKTSSGHVYQVEMPYCRFEGIEIGLNHSGASHEGFRVSANYLTIDGCIIKHHGTASADQDGVHISQTQWDYLTVINCLILDWDRAGMTVQHYSGSDDTTGIYLANNTIINNGGDDGNTEFAGGIVFNESNGTIVAELHNNIVYGIDSDDGGPGLNCDIHIDPGSGTVTVTGSNNLTRDNTYNAGSLTGGAQKTLAELDFVDDSNADYHIEATSDACDYGSDRSADTEHSELDVDGGTRSDWDAGFDEQGVVATYGGGLTGSATTAGALDISRVLALDPVSGGATVVGAALRTTTLAGTPTSGTATVAGGIDMSRALVLDAVTGDATVAGVVAVSRALVLDAVTGDATVSGTLTVLNVTLEPSVYTGWIMEIDDDQLTLISGNPLVAIGQEISRADCDITVT